MQKMPCVLLLVASISNKNISFKKIQFILKEIPEDLGNEVEKQKVLVKGKNAVEKFQASCFCIIIKYYVIGLVLPLWEMEFCSRQT